MSETSAASEEFDLGSAIDAVGRGVEGAEVPASAESPESSNLAPADTPPPADEFPLPKAWKKEMEAHWKMTPKEIRQYAHTREADVSRGIQMYRDGHERWNKLLTPYQEVLGQYPDVDPVNLLNGLMQSHLKLVFGTPEEKRAMAQQLLQSYQIDLAESQAAGTPPPPIPPELTGRLSALEQRIATQDRASVMAKVEAFFADPKNKHAAEVAPSILQYVQRGLPLEEAYTTAIWTNPTVRAKLIAEEHAATASSAAKLNVGVDTESPSPAPRKGTMDDTIKSVIAKHYNGVNL